VAHEVTHSWAGNYVTNANWSDFWLNEGFTVYIERLILGEVKKSEQYRHFEILGGYNDLIKTVADLGENHEFTKLCPDLTGIDPDDAFSKIPYEKGSLFLLYLEQVVGGASAMKGWLKTYFTDFRTTSVVTKQMKEHFLAHFAEKVSSDKLKGIDWDTWLNKPGLPKFTPASVCDRTLVADCEKLAEKWSEKGGSGKDATSNDLKSFQSRQIMFFLDLLLTASSAPSTSVVDHLDSTYGLSKSNNVEINFRFLMLALKANHTSVFPSVADFLSRHGRGLYVKPLYKALKAVDAKYAAKVYAANKKFYHAVIRTFAKQNGLDG